MAIIITTPENTRGQLEYDCTPSSLLASTPCLACISEKDMLAVIVGIVALNQAKTIAEVMEESVCFRCMSRKQMLQALVTILGSNLLGEGSGAGDVIDDIRCLQCESEHNLLAAILYQFCTAFEIQGQ